MWIDEQADDDILLTWIKHSPGLKIVIKIDGTILWANHAFCEWSQYTLTELMHLTWMQLGVPDKNLAADIDEIKNLNAYAPSYLARRQYQPKGAKPEWGVLHVMRYPLVGEINVCLCTWEPLKNGTATAFALAMERSKIIDKRLEAMAEDIQIRKDQTTLGRLWDTTGEWALQNPKCALMLLLILLSLNPLPIIVTYVSRMGWLPAQPVQIEVKDPKTGDAKPATREQLNMIKHNVQPIIDVASRATFEVTTKAGNTLTWNAGSAGGRRPVSFATGRIRRGIEPGGFSDHVAAGQGGSIEGMSGAKQY